MTIAISVHSYLRFASWPARHADGERAVFKHCRRPRNCLRAAGIAWSS